MVRAVMDRAKAAQSPISSDNAINWNDWLSREQITLDDCLLLAMGENPNAADINTNWWQDLCGDEYRKRQTEAVQWFESNELKARKINNNGSVEYKNIAPLNFFSLARSNNWDLPEPMDNFLQEMEQTSKQINRGYIQVLTDLVEKSPKFLTDDQIAELWAIMPFESYENKPFWQFREDYKKRIESAVINGELEAVVEIREPGFDDGYKEIFDKNRIRKIEDGRLNGAFVKFTIYRAPFQDWLKKTKQWPIVDNCLLRIWFDSEPKTEAPESNDPAKPIESEPKTTGDFRVFKEFENLRSNEVSFVVNDTSTKVVVRKKTITVSPKQLGLKLGSQGWKIFEGAAVSSGDLSASLKKLNKTSDLERENTNIKTAVSRLRTTLKHSMGLIDDPIAYQDNSGYKFTFKSMTHALLHGQRVTKGADALDYIDGKNQDNASFWDEDEI